MSGGDSARTNVAAIAERVATERASFAGDGVQTGFPGLITWIDDKILGAMQRHWPEITGMQCDERAG